MHRMSFQQPHCSLLIGLLCQMCTRVISSWSLTGWHTVCKCLITLCPGWKEDSQYCAMRLFQYSSQMLNSVRINSNLWNSVCSNLLRKLYTSDLPTVLPTKSIYFQYCLHKSHCQRSFNADKGEKECYLQINVRLYCFNIWEFGS